MYVGQWRHVVLKGTVETSPDLVGLGHGQARVDMDGRLHVHAVADPPDPYVGETLDAGHMLAGVDHLVDDARFHTVQHARQHGARRLPHDAENGEGDQDADDGIREGETEPNAESAGYYRQAREAVHPGVITVRDQSRAVDLASDPDAEHGDSFVPDEADQAGNGNPAKQRDGLGMKQAVDGLIACHQGAGENDQDDKDAGEVLDLAVTERECLGRSPPHQSEGDPERDGSGRVRDVVDVSARSATLPDAITTTS